jgi:serine/threonine protein kinase
LIAAVAHPSVVQFKDYGWYEGRLWFAMPWYSGQTLYERVGGDALELRTPLTRAEARPIFERLAQGLAAMHAVGIHHHDIKPDNVFLANVAGFEGGFPVLLDLGIAAAKGELPAGFTAEYAAPETANTALGELGHSIGAAADVFSLALTLRNVLDTELIADPEIPSIAILTARATLPTPAPTRKDLRYLKPNFTRWLSLDASARPTPEEFAAELSVLTEPEDRHEQRMRALRRAAPFLFAAMLAVAFLTYQLSREREVVSEQQQVISVQEEQLHEQLAESGKLRQASQQQLAELETTKNEVGSKEQQLARALGIAHDLDRQLTRLEQLRQALSERAGDLQDELNDLRVERDGLLQQRGRLESERAGLIVERDGVVQQRNSLRTERDQLITERNALTAQNQELERTRSTLADERDNLRRSIDTFLHEREGVVAERDNMRRERDQANADVTQLRAQIDSLQDELNRAKRTQIADPVTP